MSPRSCSMIAVFAFSILGAAVGRGEDPAAPKGEVAKYSFDNSRIFPGTVRDQITSSSRTWFTTVGPVRQTRHIRAVSDP